MKIIVCLKSVVMKAPEGRIVRAPGLCELNPFDRPALELALLLKERGGGLVALSMGPEPAREALFEALALGADRAVQLSDPALAGSDTLATSTALAAAIKKLSPFDLAVFGSRSADSDTGQVGPQTAAKLGLPVLTNIMSIEPGKAGLRILRKSDGFDEEFEAATPLAVTVHPRALTPRDPALGRIEAAYSGGTIETWRINDVGLSPDQVGPAGSGTAVNSMRRVRRERRCELISGSPEEQAEELVKRLLEKGLL